MKQQPHHPDTALLAIIGIVVLVGLAAFVMLEHSPREGSLATLTGNVVWSNSPATPAYEGHAIVGSVGEYAQCVDCLVSG